MKRMHRILGRESKQAFGISQDILSQLLASLDHSLRDLCDAALLQLAYDSLGRRSELVSLQITDLQQLTQGGKTRHTILLRKSKVDVRLGSSHT